MSYTPKPEDRIPAPMIAPYDKVYTVNGEYLGMIGEEGARVDHEEVTLIFMYREPIKCNASTFYYVPNQDHVA